MRACSWLLAAGLIGLPVATARAQDTPDEPKPTEQTEEEPAAPADEDMAAIQAALAADTASQDASGGAAQSETESEAREPGPVVAAIQSLNPNIAFILDVAGAWFSSGDNLQTGGHDPDHTGFNLQQVELSVSASVDPYFRVDGNLVFHLDGVEVEEFYATTLDLPGRLQLRAGQFLTRFGRLNATHPHTWDFVDQPFSVGRYFGSEGLRGLGLELSWLTPLPWYVEVVGSMQEASGDGTARSFYGGDGQGIHGIEDFLYTAAIKQFFPLSDDLSLFWGLSGAFGPNATAADAQTNIYGTDVYLKYRPITEQSYTIVSLQAEAFYRRRGVPGAVLSDVSGYAYVFWRFAQRWATAARYEWGTPPRDGSGHITPDDLDPEWTANRHRVSADVSFWPSEFSRLRVQGSVDLPQWRPDPIYAVFLAAEFVAGAHGAHKF